MNKQKWNTRPIVKEAKQDRGKKAKKAISKIKKIPFSDDICYFWADTCWVICEKGKVLGIGTAMSTETQIHTWLLGLNPNTRRLTSDLPKRKLQERYYLEYCKKEERDFLRLIEQNSKKKLPIDELDLSYL